MTYEPQVGKEHYSGKAYRSLERWSSYWHQLELVRSASPQTVLEVGVGEGVVARELKATGVAVTTLDIATDLHPDIVGSVTAIPTQDRSYDLVLAAEILEHIAFKDVPQALRELARVARTHVVISIPHPGYVFSCLLNCRFCQKLTSFCRSHFFGRRTCSMANTTGSWGKKDTLFQGLPLRLKMLGLHLLRIKYADDPGHRFFVFSV